MRVMTITFNPSEVGMVKLGKDTYQINANDRLEDKIVIFGHLPFELKGDRYVNEEGITVYIK